MLMQTCIRSKAMFKSHVRRSRQRDTGGVPLDTRVPRVTRTAWAREPNLVSPHDVLYAETMFLGRGTIGRAHRRQVTLHRQIRDACVCSARRRLTFGHAR